MSNLGNKVWQCIEKNIYRILNWIFKLMGRELSDEIFSSMIQFVRFGIVGVSNTLVSYLIYLISLVTFEKAEIHMWSNYLAAQIISFVLSVLWSFYWNERAVFILEEGKKRSVWRTLLKTYISYSFTGLFLNSILLLLWIQVFHISEYVAPMINLLVSVPINFVINKFWAFKEA